GRRESQSRVAGRNRVGARLGAGPAGRNRALRVAESGSRSSGTAVFNCGAQRFPDLSLGLSRQAGRARLLGDDLRDLRSGGSATQTALLEIPGLRVESDWHLAG